MPADPEILVVDDNQADLDLLLLFAAEAGLHVRFRNISNGADALHDLLTGLGASPRRVPDLVLLDLGLPRLPGLEVLRLLRQARGGDGVPVVVLSTSARDEDQQRARALGILDYWTKPRDLEEYPLMIERMATKLGQRH